MVTKKNLLAGCSLTAMMAFGASAAMADGYSVPAPEPVAPAEDLCFDKGLNDFVPCEVEEVFVGPWTGFYAGIHGGYGASDWGGGIDYDDDDDEDVDFDDLSDSGFVVGGQIGYNHQLPSNFVLGVEGDFSYLAGFDDSVDIPSSRVGGELEADVDWLASLRLKAGYAMGDFMPFISGGIGFAGYEVSRFDDNGDLADRANNQGDNPEEDVAVGAVFGGGLEYMIAPNMLIRGEGLYYIFNEETSFGAGADALELEDVIVGRVALSIKF